MGCVLCLLECDIFLFDFCLFLLAQQVLLESNIFLWEFCLFLLAKQVLVGIQYVSVGIKSCLLAQLAIKTVEIHVCCWPNGPTYV